MIYLIFWCFAAYGLTNILMWGSIFDTPRHYIIKNSKFFGTLISCVLCTSTWVGFFMSILFGGLTVKLFDINPYLGFFFDGMFTAGTVWAINSIIEYFENKTNN